MGVCSKATLQNQEFNDFQKLLCNLVIASAKLGSQNQTSYPSTCAKFIWVLSVQILFKSSERENMRDI